MIRRVRFRLRWLLLVLPFIQGAWLLHLIVPFCPFTFSIVRSPKPVMYGYALGWILDSELQDKVALGGCIVGWTSAVCPHCHLPVKFFNPDALEEMPDLDVNALFATALDERGRLSLREHVTALLSSQREVGHPGVIAAALGESDLWLSSRFDGLQRMDLRTGDWISSGEGEPWGCPVRSITIHGGAVEVEYSPFEPTTCFQTALTTDRGQTWRVTKGNLTLRPKGEEGEEAEPD